MDLFTIAQHFNELSDLPRTGLGPLDVLNSKQDGIPVLTVERCKERLGVGVCIERLLQVVGDG